MSNKPADLWKKIDANKTPGTMPVSEVFWSKFKPGNQILEVGCGWGRIIENCLDRKLRVVGIDINLNEIIALTTKLNKDGVDSNLVEIYEKSVLDTGFKDNKFDGIIMQGVLSALSRKDRMKCLEEVYRMLKPGGCVHIGEFQLNDSDPIFKKRYDEDFLTTKEYGTLSVKDGNGNEMYQSHNFSIDEITDMLKRSGFASTKVIKDIFTSYHGNKKPGMMIISKK